MSSRLRSAAHRAKGVAGRSPAGLRLLAAAGRVRREWVVRPDFDACIDGYPRSGNSFAVRLFRTWNPEVQLGHHVHLPAQILLAVSYGLPTAVLLREPVGAATSHAAYSGGALSPATALWGYISFYEGIERVADEVAIVPFEEIADDVANLVERLNDRYGASFEAGRHEGGREEILAKERRWSDSAAPGAVGEAEREEIRRRIETAPGLEAARAAHARLLRAAASD